jgi:quercetin dioxygenase-like cupin family protein
MSHQTEKGATTIVQSENYSWILFPIPGATGDLQAVLLNTDVTQGPVTAILKMPAGSRIPAHYHKKSTESFYVLEGDFINKGTEYGAGAFFAVKPLDIHGPHETKNGCTIMFLQSTEVDPEDFFIAE